MQEKILVVDDDAMNLVRTKKILDKMYNIFLAESGSEALDILEEQDIDLVLLDIEMPGMNGIETFRRMQRFPVKVPVIFLTASGDEASVVTGLNIGADDYITKPFRSRELIARIGSALRKAGRAPTAFEMGGLRVDTASGLVKKEGREIFLSALEYRLLLVFINNPGNIITRDRLLDELWDAAGEFVNNNTLTVYIKRLREKIENDPASPRIILTVRGIGYRLGGNDVSK